MATLKGVLFDKDGTLIDFAGTWRAVTDGLLEELADGDADVATEMGRAIGYDRTTNVFLPGSPLVAGSISEVAGLLQPFAPRLSAQDIEDRANRRAMAMGAGELAPAPALRPTLERLQEMGMRLGVGTHDAEGAARTQVRLLGVEDLFDFIVGYDSGVGLKPGPGMPRAFAEAIGVEPEETVMVGDSLHDLGAGRSAGCAHVVAVLTGVATEADLAPHADVVLPSIAALPDYLSRSA